VIGVSSTRTPLWLLVEMNRRKGSARAVVLSWARPPGVNDAIPCPWKRSGPWGGGNSGQSRANKSPHFSRLVPPCSLEQPGASLSNAYDAMTTRCPVSGRWESHVTTVSPTRSGAASLADPTRPDPTSPSKQLEPQFDRPIHEMPSRTSLHHAATQPPTPSRQATRRCARQDDASPHAYA
jgi:hypothetical protein